MRLPTENQIKSTDTYEMLKTLIRLDKVGRPQYSFGTILAVEQARAMGIESMVLVEFGVFTGNGLRELATVAVLLAEATGMRFRVLGFDTGIGMPQPVDYRDHPETWPLEDLKMPDPDEVRKTLPQHPLVECELVIGDVAETVPARLSAMLSPSCPLGFVSVDVDTYSATVSCLRAFQGPSDHYLPSVPVYFDDAEYNLSVCSRTGESLAIAEFIAANPLRWIEKKPVRRHYASKPWHELMYFCQVLDHPVRDPAAGIHLNLNVLSY